MSRKAGYEKPVVQVHRLGMSHLICESQTKEVKFETDIKTTWRSESDESLYDEEGQ